MEGASFRHIAQVKGLPVFDLETSGELGLIEAWRVEPNTQKIIAFCIKKGAWLSRPLFLATTDVVEYDEKMVVIRSKDALTEESDIVGLADVPKKGGGVVGCQATTQSGRTLGTVKDFIFEVAGSRIYQYVIDTPKGELILKSERVVSITPKRIIFNDEVSIPSGATTREEANLA